MAILPLPERGQPLDVTYIYQIVQSINELYTQVAPSKIGYLVVDTERNGPQTTKTSGANVIGGYELVSASSLQAAASSVPWSHDFEKEFRYPPIVTATAFNKGVNDAGKDVTVTINSITTSKVEGTVKFNLGGETTMGINIIAVGIPNS
jgi:hypothetical protein